MRELVAWHYWKRRESLADDFLSANTLQNAIKSEYYWDVVRINKETQINMETWPISNTIRI
jgi:hypothetical protein